MIYDEDGPQLIVSQQNSLPSLVDLTRKILYNALANNHSLKFVLQISRIFYEDLFLSQLERRKFISQAISAYRQK